MVTVGARKSKLHKLPSVAEDSGCTYVCLDNLGGVDQYQLRRGLVDASIEGVKVGLTFVRQGFESHARHMLRQP